MRCYLWHTPESAKILNTQHIIGRVFNMLKKNGVLKLKGFIGHPAQISHFINGKNKLQGDQIT